jgi:hypothetical protein
VCAGDVFVDDKTSALVKWCEHQERGRAVQWWTPHNRLDKWNGYSTCDWGVLADIARREVP